MNNRKTKQSLGILPLTLLLSFFIAAVYADDCQQAQVFYEMANAAQLPPEKIELYRQSISLCPSFAAYYMLGNTYMKMNRISDAILQLENAVNLDQKSAETFFLLGDAYMELNKLEDALFNFRLGLGLKRIPLYEERLNQTKIRLMNNGTPAHVIEKVLERGILYRARGHQLIPAIDIKIHFDLDKYTLSGQGKTEAAELGKALTALLKNHNTRGFRTDDVTPYFSPQSSSLAGQFRFRLTGHTDSRGSDEYNDTLALNRAKTVKSFLIEHYDIKDEVIEVEGKGERELLLQNAGTEEEHEKNRRVEVAVISY